MVMVMVMVNASLREGWLPQTQDSEEGDCDNKTSSCAAVNNTCISSRIQRLNRKGDNMLHCRVPLLQLNELKIDFQRDAYRRVYIAYTNATNFVKIVQTSRP